jgi:hypothetical protein
MSGSDAHQVKRGLLAAASGAVVLTAVLAGFLADEERLHGSLELTGMWLAIAFFGCEWLALRIEREHGEQYGFTLMLVPLAVGLVFAPPLALIAARVVGVAAAMLATRHRKLHEAIYELAIHGLQVATAAVAYRLALDGAAPDTLQGAFALVTGLFASFATAGVVLVLCVSIVGRRWVGATAALNILRAGALAATLNGAIGVGLVFALWHVPNVLLVLTGIVLAGLVCNMAYRGLLHRHRRLQTHYAFVSSVVRSTDMAEITASVLDAARELLKADDVLLLLRPAGPDEPARRLHLGTGGGEVLEVPPLRHVEDLKALMPQAKPQFVVVDDTSPDWLRNLGNYATLAAPLTSTERAVVGALSSPRPGERWWTPSATPTPPCWARWPSRRRSPSRTACSSTASSARPPTVPTRPSTTSSPGCRTAPASATSSAARSTPPTRPGGGSGCSSSTSTRSARWSTRSGTTARTACWCRRAVASAGWCRRTPCSPDSAPSSSPSCCPTSASPTRPSGRRAC